MSWLLPTSLIAMLFVQTAFVHPSAQRCQFHHCHPLPLQAVVIHQQLFAALAVAFQTNVLHVQKMNKRAGDSIDEFDFNQIGQSSQFSQCHLASSSHFKEPDEGSEGENKVRFGRMAYWDETYKSALIQTTQTTQTTQTKQTIQTNTNHENDENEEPPNEKDAQDAQDTQLFSWYSSFEDIQPFFSELVPTDAKILVPGIGNDPCIRDMFDYGYHHLAAFDYAPEGVECARRMMGSERMDRMLDLRVADARSLEMYDDEFFDAVFEKGTLDSIYLSGGKDKELSKTHLDMAVGEMARVLRPGGIVFSVTAACADAVQEAFSSATCGGDDGDDGDDGEGEGRCCWRQIRDGSFYVTEDGFTSNNVDATMLVWQKI